MDPPSREKWMSEHEFARPEDAARKYEFLAMLAHELRNPLAPIAQAVHLMRRGGAGADTSRLYDIVERQTQRLSRLVDGLLDAARISQGRIQLTREIVDLRQIARNAVEATHTRIAERQHKLAVDLPNTQVCTLGDAIRLEQVVINLLENAAKYTPPGGELMLQLTQSDNQGILRVADNGIGLERESQEIIFEPFTQLHSSLDRTNAGLGMGLMLARQVLALHGGQIEAHSDGLGKGSEFIVRLPLEVTTALVDGKAATDDSFAGIQAHHHRVMIVDDNVDAAETIAILARSWGHEVAIAHDGPSAIALARTFDPQICVLDIGLPGMSGYELAERLRLQGPRQDVRLVALTGYGREEDRIAARSAGFDAHLIKPADIDDLQKFLNMS